MKKIGLQQLKFPASKTEVNNNYMHLTKIDKSIMAKQQALCHAELKDHAELHTLDGDSSKQSHIQQMAKQEKMCQKFRNVKLLHGLNCKKGHFTSLQVPTNWSLPTHVSSASVKVLILKPSYVASNYHVT
jgi:hypothetical protein